jgi:outer membrane receptor for ferrienterochelin and colicins
MSAKDLQNLSLDQLLALKVVTGSLEEQKLMTTPVVLSVIGAETFQRYGYRSLAEALQSIPGFDVLYDYAYYNAGVRGVSGGMHAQSSVIKVMVGGQPLGFSPTTGNLIGPEAFPLLAIKQVEVVRGPASAIYGANAFLGVVNIIPYRAAELGEGHVRARAGYLNQWGGSGGTLDLLGWMVAGGIDLVVGATLTQSDRSGLTLPDTAPLQGLVSSLHPGETQGDIERTVTGSLRAEAHPFRADGELTLDGALQFVERGARFYSDSSPLADGRISVLNGYLRLAYVQPFKDRFKSSSSVSYMAGAPTDLERLIDDRRSQIDYLQRSMSYNDVLVRSEVSYTSPKKMIFASLVGDYLYDLQTLPSLVGYQPPDPPVLYGLQDRSKAFQNIGVTGQLTVTPLQRLQLTGGLRYEYNSLYASQVSFRLALLYLVNEKLTLKLLGGNSFKAPSAYLLYGVKVVEGGPTGNEKLKPQEATTGELALSWQPADWLTTDLSLFYTHITDFAQIDTASVISRAQNNATIDSVGGEAYLQVQFFKRRLNAFASLSYVWTHKESQSLIPGQSTSGPTALFPAFTSSVGVSMTFPRAYLRLFATDNYIFRRYADPSTVAFTDAQRPTSYPDYNALSAGVASSGLRFFRNQETIFMVKVSNVLNQSYREPGYLGIEVPGEKVSVWVTADTTF